MENISLMFTFNICASALRSIALVLVVFICAYARPVDAIEARPSSKADSISSAFTGGNSAIRGRIWTKGALLARKVYPPEGSIVTIIVLTEELRLWFERMKDDPQFKANPEAVLPKEIAAHFSHARILNDRGEFVFERLKPGAYLLIATTGITNNRQFSETVGTVDQYVNRQHVGSYAVTETYSYKTMQQADLQEFVIIDADGKTVEVELKKRRVWDSPWW